MILKKENTMSDPIEDIIRSGRLMIERDQQEKKARQERIDAFYLARAAKRNDMAIGLIPEVLQPFARVEEPDILTISVPDCAIVKRRFVIRDSSSAWDAELNDWFTSIESVSFSETIRGDSFWRIYTWREYYNDDEWEAVQSLWSEDNTSDLNRALAVAADVGDNRKDVEEEIFFKNSQKKESTPENTPVREPEKTLLCPLLYADCKREGCSWWHAEKNKCAVLIMAYWMVRND
jgi:hypothetical protein